MDTTAAGDIPMTNLARMARRAMNGESLAHRREWCPVDGLHALGRARGHGAVLLKFRLQRDDAPSVAQLTRTVRAIADAEFRRKGWIVREKHGSRTRESLMAAFADQVAAEWLGEPCRSCKGRGYLGGRDDHKTAVRTCIACEGTGRKPESSRARGRAMGMDHAHILSTWQERFTHVLSRLRGIEREAFSGINRGTDHQGFGGT